MKLPVAVFTWPMISGPNRPPRLATELIKAMPPAAAAPVRNSGGSVQNVGNMHFAPAKRHRHAEDEEPARIHAGDG